ncbi:MAG: hypothetical protein D6706_18450 [Chloroflexi bacterium]|nr:MAG: hypothetical protein D6706_18450 [Chloroflexota bacterium]
MKKRNYIYIEGIATALDPIHQGGDTTGGTIAEFRRELTRVDNVYEYMPVISANSMAGLLRRETVQWVLDQIGFEKFTADQFRQFDILTSGGGRVTAANTPGYVDLFTENELRELFPTVSLFGGSIGNRMIKGRVRVDPVVPICVEMKQRLPAELHELADRWHIEDMLQELNFSAMDNKESSDWRDYLDPLALEQWKSEKEQRAQKGQAPDNNVKMRYGVECLAAGSMFHLGFLLKNPTEVELGTFLGGLGYYFENPIIGGKSNRGFGRIHIDLKQYKLLGFQREEGELAVGAVQAASEFLAGNAERIKQFIREGL